MVKTGEYAKVVDGRVVGVVGQPGWRRDDGTDLTDAEYVTYGLYPIYHDRPVIEPQAQWLVQGAEWQIQADRVVVPFKVYDMVQPPERDVYNVYEPLPANHWEFDDAAGTVTRHRVVPLTPEQSRDKALGYLAADRWEYEVGGIAYTRPTDGKTYGLTTDRDSQAKLAAERTAALAGLRDVGDVWKCLDLATGAPVWVPFEDAEIIEIAGLARAHVAGAYRREGELAALIVAGDLTVTWSPPSAA